MKNKKDAYLLLIHKNNYVLETLLSLLDDDNNDIYIHIDKKSKTINIDEIKNKIKKSNIYFVERVRCNWGGFSIVKAELNLLKESTKNDYRYYHLLSGQDLPIKSQNQIYEYFTNNYGKQFVSFQEKNFIHQIHVRYYYPFQELFGRNSFKSLHGKIICKPIRGLQKLLNVYRNENVSFQKGDQWFSITDEFAKYIVSKEKELEKIFKNTYCPDEIFIQTLLINSKFKDSLYSYEYNNPKVSVKRYIDWTRGNPYVWKNEDFKELIESDALFARKFDSNIDKEIIDKIKEYVSK